MEVDIFASRDLNTFLSRKDPHNTYLKDNRPTNITFIQFITLTTTKYITTK